MPAAAFSVARHAPSGKPPPMPLAEAMMSGVTPQCHRRRARRCAPRRTAPRRTPAAGPARRRPLSPDRNSCVAGGCRLALDRLEQEARRILVDRRQRRVEVVELDDGEARQQRRKPVAGAWLIRRADRGHRPAVERVGEGNQVVLVRIALGEMVAARGLDRALHASAPLLVKNTVSAKVRSTSRCANASP